MWPRMISIRPGPRPPSRPPRRRSTRLQAKYDQEFGLHKELQKNYNDAKFAAAREEEITGFLPGRQGSGHDPRPDGRSPLEGSRSEGQDQGTRRQEYKLFMRRYILKDEATGLKHNGRWVIIKFEPLA